MDVESGNPHPTVSEHDLEESKELLLRLIIDSGGLVVLGHFRCHGSGTATSAGPVQPFPDTEDGDGLLLLESTTGIILVTLEPSGLFGPANIRVIPRSTPLHVGDIFGTDFTLLDALPGIQDR